MAVAYALWYVGLSRIGAAATGATALGIPLVGVAGSWLFLGESIGPVVLLAGVLILGGLHLVLGARHA
jgi:O-acetylserine/cysteine efflux transporter